MDPVVVTLVTVPAILGLVTVARDLGMPAKLAPVTAAIVGTGLGVAEQMLGGSPVFQAGAGGLLVGLAATGLYDTAKLAGGQSEARRAIE